MAERSSGSLLGRVFGIKERRHSKGSTLALIERIVDTLRDQLLQDQPDVRLLSETFDAYEQEKRVKNDGDRAEPDASPTREELSEVCAVVDGELVGEGAVHKLLPCILFLYFKLRQWHTQLEDACGTPMNVPRNPIETPSRANTSTSSGDVMHKLGGFLPNQRTSIRGISDTLNSWLGKISDMPEHFDSLLLKKSEVTENYKFILDTFCPAMNADDKGLLWNIVASEVRCGIRPNSTVRLKTFFTFLRLDMKYCYLCSMESSKMWQRYMHFEWTNLPSVTSMDFCDGVMAAIGHCKEADCLSQLDTRAGMKVVHWLSGLSGTTPVTQPATLDECWDIHEKLHRYTDGEPMDIDKVFCALMQKSHQSTSTVFNVSLRLVSFIAQEYGSAGGVLDEVLKEYIESRGLPDLLTLVSNFYISEECTTAGATKLTECFNRIIKDCSTAVQVRIEHVTAFYRRSHVNRSLVICLLRAILHRGNKKLQWSPSSKPVDVCKLLEEINQEEPTFISHNYQQIIDYLRPFCNGSIFNVFSYCKSLGKLKLQHGDAVAIAESQYPWRLPESGSGLRKLAFWIGMSNSYQKLERCLSEALACIHKCSSDTGEDTLAYTWWDKLCQGGMVHFKECLASDRKETTQSFCVFIQNCLKRYANCPTLVWTMCSYFVPECLGEDICRPWVVSDSDLLLRPCNLLYFQMKSADQIISGSEKWIVTIEQVLQHHHSLMSQKLYTVEDYLNEYKDHVNSFNCLFDIFELPSLNAVPSPLHLLAKLESERKLVDWLLSLGMRSLEQLAAQLQDVCSIQLAMYKQFEDKLLSTQEALQPLQDSGPSPPDQSGDLFTYKIFLEQLRDSESLMFKPLVAMFLSSATSISFVTVLEAIQKAHEFLQDFLTAEIPFAELEKLRDKIPELSISGEVDALRKTWVYRSIEGAADFSLEMQDLFLIKEYINHVPSLLEVLSRHNTINSDLQDDDVDFLNSVHSKFLLQPTLKDLLASSSGVKKILSSVTDAHLAVVLEVQENGQLLTFFQEQQLCRECGEGNLSLKRQHSPVSSISSRIDLLLAATTAYRCLQPLFAESNISLSRAIQLLSESRIQWRAISHIRLANENMVSIQELVRQAHSGSTDRALNIVKALEQSGRVDFFFNRFNGKPSEFTVFYNVESKASDKYVPLSKEDMLDLLLKMLLCENGGETEHRTKAMAFFAIFDTIQDLEEIFEQLELSGCVALQKYAPSRRLSFNIKSLKTSCEHFQNELETWLDALEEARSSCPTMRLLSTLQIGQLLTLTTPGKLSGAVVSQMTSKSADDLPAWTQGQAPSEGETLLLDKCIRSILYSTLGLTKAIPVSNRKIRMLLIKRAQSSSRSPHEHLKSLQSLVNCLLLTDSYDDHDPSQGKQHVCSVSSAGIPSLMYNRILSLFNVADEGPLPSQCQLMFCSMETTVDELQEFVRRANVCPGRRFLMVGVDKLSSEAGKKLVKLQQSQCHSDENGDICYVFIDSPASTAPSLQKVDISCCDFVCQYQRIAHVLEWLKSQQGRHRSTVGTRPQLKVHCCPPLSTHSSARRRFTTDICINNIPDVGGIIRCLINLPEKADVYFYISGDAPLETVNGIFFQLLVLGSLVDPQYGTTFSFPLQTDWTWWIDLPSSAWHIGIDERITTGMDGIAQLFLLLSALSLESHVVSPSAKHCSQCAEQVELLAPSDVQIANVPQDQRMAASHAFLLCKMFVKDLGVNSFYGFKEDNTLPSLFLSHICPAPSGDIHSHFELFTAPLHKLREKRHSWLLASCSPIQQIAHCVCSELLQLVPPEIFLLKLSSLKEADVYSYIYFNILQNNSSGLTEIVKDRTPAENTDAKSFKTTCSSKLMIFSRISGTLQSLHLTFNEFFGSSVSQHMRVESASIYQSKASIDSMLEEFERSEKTCCLVTIHPRQIDDLRIWHQLMSEAKTENSKGISKFYILCFAIPAIDIHFESCYTASLLSGWNCMYLDSMKIPPIPLRHFSTLFVREAVGLINNLASSERPSESATLSLMREPECNQYLYESAVTEFVCGVRSLFPAIGRLPDMTAGQFYWNDKTARTRALKYVLDKQPLVWQRAQQLLYQVLNDDKLFQVIREVAVDIVSKKISCSLSNQVSDYVRRVVVRVFGFLMSKLCHSYGLATIFKWNDETLDCLLKLVAAPKTHELQHDWIIDCVTGGEIQIRTPFFLLINNRIQVCLEPYKTIQLREFHDHILSDKNLSDLLHSRQAENFQKCFCSDHLLLQVYRKSSALSADCSERKAIDIILCWLDRCRESEFPSASLMALTYWACTAKANEVRVLFDIGVALLEMGACFENGPTIELNTWLRNSVHYLKELAIMDTEKHPKRMANCREALRCISAGVARLHLDVLQTFSSDELAILKKLKTHVWFAAAIKERDPPVAMLRARDEEMKEKKRKSHTGRILQFVLFCLETGENLSTSMVLELLNDVDSKFSGGVQQYRQISIQILQILRQRFSSSLDHDLEAILNVTGVYYPMICLKDHNPETHSLAHAYFEDRWEYLKTRRLSPRELLREAALDGSTLFHSIRQTAARFVLMERFIAVISDPKCRVERIPAAFSSLLSGPHFELTPPSPYSLYILKRISTIVGLGKVSRIATSSTISWWSQSRHMLGHDLPTPTGYSFMFSKEDAERCGFIEARTLYIELKTELQKCGRRYHTFIDWCKTKLICGTLMDGFVTKSWLKGICLLVIYYEYFRQNKHNMLQGLNTVIQQLFPECNSLERGVFRIFLDDSFRQKKTTHFQDLFTPANNDETDNLVRDVLINFVVSSLFLTSSRPSHWRTLLLNPEALIGTEFFGAANKAKLSGDADGVKVNTCCSFRACGGHIGEVSYDSGLSLRGRHVSGFFTFGALFWHSLIIDESKPAAVLTESVVDKFAEPEWPHKLKVQKFCFKNAKACFIHVREGSSTRDIMGNQRCSLFLTRCLEYLSHYVRTHRQVFREKFKDEEARQKAESIFQLDIVQRAFEQGSPRFDSIQPTDLQESVSRFPDFVPHSVGLSDMAESLKSRALTGTNSLAPLVCFVGKVEVLKLVYLFPNLMALFKLIHKECPGKFRMDSKATDIASLTEGCCADDVLKTFNKFHNLSNGQIRPGPCTAENTFEKASSDTTLAYFLRHLSMMLVSIMEYQTQFFDNVFEAVDAIEQTDDTAVCLFKEKMAILKACCEQQGRVKVEHLDLSSREPEGLLHIDLEEIDRIVSCYSYKIFPPCSSQSHSYQWIDLQYSLLYNVMKRAYRGMDIGFVRKQGIELLEHALPI